jgi:hypothetical protein
VECDAYYQPPSARQSAEPSDDRSPARSGPTRWVNGSKCSQCIVQYLQGGLTAQSVGSVVQYTYR